MYYSCRYASPVGLLHLASNGSDLVGLWMEGQKYFGGTLNAPLEPDTQRPEFRRATAWLDAYFEGANPSLDDFPLAPMGTAFQQAVWQELLRIPYGETTTYGAIANRIAASMNRTRMSGQAVGGAVGHNPIAIIIPCHRVVSSNGSLTGYAGGIQNKVKLLTLEGVNVARFSVPTRGTAI